MPTKLSYIVDPCLVQFFISVLLICPKVLLAWMSQYYRPFFFWKFFEDSRNFAKFATVHSWAVSSPRLSLKHDNFGPHNSLTSFINQKRVLLASRNGENGHNRLSKIINVTTIMESNAAKSVWTFPNISLFSSGS